MSDIPAAAWIAFLGIAFAVGVAMLYGLGCRLEREMEEHTLQRKAHRLRLDYSRWIEALRRGEGDQFERPSGFANASNRRDAA